MSNTTVTAADVRAWARENDQPVGTRGHIAQSVIDAFNKGKRESKRFVNTNPRVAVNG